MESRQETMQISPAPIFKGKIAHYLSYPLRTSEICERIAVHAKDYPFTFCYFNYRAPKQNHPDSVPYAVCELRFTTKLVPETGCICPEWELTVRPVLRSHRSVISNLLVSDGFQKFESWLTHQRTPLWFSSSHWLTVEYLPESPSLLWNDSA